MAFPSSIPSYTGFTSTHTLSQDQHASQHNAEQADIIALAQKVGTGASTPVNNTVLRGNGTGTTTYDQVHLATDTSGVLGIANGGTGQTSLTSLPLVSPAITNGGSWTGGPTLSGPNISDFTSAQHNHSGPSGGGGLGNGIVSYATLLSSIFSGQVQTYTNSGGGAGTGYYINLGGVKICWGIAGTSSLGSGSNSASLPNGFFSGISYVNINMYSPNTTNFQFYLTSYTTSSVTGFLSNPLSNGQITWLVIGS